MPPAITITLYDKDDQPIKTYERAIIPWGILKRATRLMDQFADQNPTAAPATTEKWFWQRKKKSGTEVRQEEKQLEAISQFVVELFGNQFTVRDLENGADVGEIMAVFQSVIARANATVKANPITRQSTTTKK